MIVKTKEVHEKKWVLEELSKENPKDEETLVQQGAIVCGLSANTIRPILRTLIENIANKVDDINKTGDET